MSALSATVARVAGRALPERAGTGGPRVSIVLAVYDPPIPALRSQLEAIAGQTSRRWECIVVDDASTNPEVARMLEDWTSAGSSRSLIRRATNGGIAAATNDGIEASSGDIITICDHDDVIDPAAIASIIAHFDAHRDDDVVYTDERLITATGATISDYRKPDYSPRRHLGHHYLAHLVAARRAAIGDLRVDRAFEPAQDYDFYLRVIERATARGRGVGHIAQILYSWRAIAGSSARAAADKPEMTNAVRRCVQAALDRRGIAATAVTVEHDGVPTTSVRLVDEPPPIAPTMTVIELGVDTRPAEINASVSNTNDELILLSPNPATFGQEWAAPLIAEITRDGVGAVGPMIVRASDTNEMPTVLSFGRTMAGELDDQYAGTPANNPGPWGAFFVAREVTAVAPAGLVVRRSLFEAVGGLAVDVGLDHAIAELCVRLARTGSSTVWSPDATLTIDLPRGAEALLESCFPDPSGSTLAQQFSRIAQRNPGIGLDRFATSGVSDQPLGAPNPYQEARRLLASGAIELVTCDVFDTIVTRSVARPSDLFTELGRRLIANGLVRSPIDASVVAQSRRDAERRARAAFGASARATARVATPLLTDHEIDVIPGVAAPECTLDEVWSLVSWISDVDRSRAIELELALESELLHPIAEAVELLRSAAEHGVPVVLVSDIYLSAAQLREVLDRCGFDVHLVDEIVTSADHRVGKAQGLLRHVIDSRGVAPSGVMHIGDNPLADVDTADRLGAHPIHVDMVDDKLHTTTPHPALRHWSRAQGSDLGISATIRSTLITSGSRFEASYQYGAAVIGPALAGFSRWIATTTADLGAGHVHCLLREGATIAELLDTTSPDGPVPITVHASRWVTMRAAVIDASPDELYTALARRADLTVDHVVDAFDCDAQLVLSILGDRAIPPGRLMQACERLSEHDELRGQIRAAAADLRARTLTYLRQRLVIDTGPIVVTDVGWGGTIQEGLERILRSDGIDNEVIGLYFALSSPGEARLARGARMMSYLPNEFDDAVAALSSRTVSHHADTVERIMTPEMGTLIGHEIDGTPVTRSAHDDRLPVSLHDAQRGVRDVVARLTDPTSGFSDLTDPRWCDLGLRAAFAQSISDTVAVPSAALAAVLGSWPHDDVAGTDHRSIAGDSNHELLRYANARDLKGEEWGRAWIAAAATVANPALAAQLAAARAGVPLDQLCPDGEAGMARLAAFPIGSDLATIQISRKVAVSAAGWSLLYLAGPVESLRSIRFDAGEHATLVEIGMFSISIEEAASHDGHANTVGYDIDDATSPDLLWVDAHPIDRRYFSNRAGGHLIVPIEPALGRRAREIKVAVAFRATLLDPASSLAEPPLAHRLSSQRRRVVSGLRRRMAN